MTTHFSPNEELHPVITMATRAIQKFGEKATPTRPEEGFENKSNSTYTTNN